MEERKHVSAAPRQANSKHVTHVIHDIIVRPTEHIFLLEMKQG
jgi:hypothetical protein